MRYFIGFSGVGLFTFLASITSDSIWLSIILVNASISFMAVGLAYGLRKPGIFLKRKAGHMSFFSYLVFWPYWTLNSLGLAIYRLLGIENPMDEVIPGLYLGSKPMFIDKARLTQHGISSVIDLTAELYELDFIRSNFRYLCIPILDNCPPSLQQLCEAIPWIEANMKDGAVLVHCAYGHSRSATFVAAYLLHTNKVAGVETVVEFIKSKRPTIGLTAGQKAVLQEFANQCS